MTGHRHRIGIIGCGWIAPFHVQALNRLKERVQVSWVADPQIERARSVGQLLEAEVVDVLADYREALSEVDAAFVLVPHHLHHPIAVEALEADCHVLLEKPFALTLAEADDMIAKADEKGKLLMVALPHRYRKSTRKFRELVAGGAYGKLFFLDAMMDENQRGYVSGWLTRKATLGGGVFFSSSPHMLDVMLWIGGDVETISMVGTTAGLPMEGEDTALSVMKFKSGAVGSTRHTWFSPKPGNWYTLRAFCEKAIVTLTVNPLGDLVSEGHRCPWESRLEVSGVEDRVILESSEGLDLFEEVKHFFDCIEGDCPCQTDGRIARKLMEIILRAYEKAADERGL